MSGIVLEAQLPPSPEVEAPVDDASRRIALDALGHAAQQRPPFLLGELQSLTSSHTRLARERYEPDIPTMHALAVRMAEGDKHARSVLFESFMPTAVQNARGVWHRQGRTADLDDLVQSAFIELWSALDRVANLVRAGEIEPEGIGGLLVSSLRGGIKSELSSRIRVKLSSKEIVELANFRRRLNAQKQAGERIDIHAIAADMEIAIDRAMGWYTLCGNNAFYYIDSPDDQDDVEGGLYRLMSTLDDAETDQSPKTRNTVERGLELLTRRRALAVARHHGFGFFPTSPDQPNPLDDVAMAHVEAGAFLGLTEAGAKALYYEAIHSLEEIIPALIEGTFDYEAWLTRNPRVRGAQVFLAAIGVPVPDLQHSLDEIRAQAVELVRSSDLSPVDKDIVMLGFGLETGIAQEWGEIAPLVNMPNKNGVNWHAKQSLKTLRRAYGDPNR